MKYLAPDLLNGMAYLSPDDYVATPPIDPPPTGTTNNKVTQSLITAAGSPRVNMTNIEWALFKELRAGALKAPVAQGTAETTDNAAAIYFEVDPVIVPAGQYFLVLTDSNGIITLACKVQVTT